MHIFRIRAGVCSRFPALEVCSFDSGGDESENLGTLHGTTGKETPAKAFQEWIYHQYWRKEHRTIPHNFSSGESTPAQSSVHLPKPPGLHAFFSSRAYRVDDKLEREIELQSPSNC